ncbi:MAG: hypothetical protein DME40_05185 [Verrucomicrobia bacterium]|nr:MAG: hypothetical protein DME40_05185 [Verrucomicrobiota bacterium]
MIKIYSNKNRAIPALVATFISLSVIGTARSNDTVKQVAPIVAQIQHADYAGDRAAMQKGCDDLKPFLEDLMFGLPGFHESERPGARERISWPDHTAGEGSD